MGTDQEWEKWGRKDPYFAVLTHSKFRLENISHDIKTEFFESGTRDIDHVIKIVKQHFNSSFSPRKALDFGCGTGRLLIPLSQIAQEVVGVDVSESMLKEAGENCKKRSIENVTLIKSDNCLSGLNGSFDFIHSFIVFQHIPPDRGKRLFQRLVDSLEKNGICAIQITYANSKHVKKTGRYLFNSLKWLLRIPKKWFKRLFLRNTDPEMEMNKYDLNEILYIVQNAGIKDFYAEYTDHSGELGVYLYFCKKS